MADSDNNNQQGRELTPAYVVVNDLKGVKDHVSLYDMCVGITKVVSQQDLDGCQQIGGLWKIYLKSVNSKVALVTQGIDVNGVNINVHEYNPFVNRAQKSENRNVRVNIKDLPISLPNDDVERLFLEFGLELKSDVKYGFIRDSDGNLTTFKNGDRFAYVKKESIPTNGLPRFYYFGIYKCRIFHYGQPVNKKECFNCFSEEHFSRQCTSPRACRVCRLTGHREGDPVCEFYEPQPDTVTFQGEEDEYSNFYPCSFNWCNISWKSSEHAWLYSKAMKNGKPDLAGKIRDAPDAKQAKALSKYIQCVDTWDKENYTIMEDIVRNKVQQVPEVKRRLLHDKDKVLAEAVPNLKDKLWSTCLDKTGTFNTKKEKWLGDNYMGKILMKVRNEEIAKKSPPRSQENRSSSGTRRPRDSDGSSGNSTKKVNKGPIIYNSGANAIESPDQSQRKFASPVRKSREGKNEKQLAITSMFNKQSAEPFEDFY